MMKDWKQRLTAAVATAAMVASILPVTAIGLTADATISVTGIDAGDSAAYYQVVQQNTSTKAWELTTAFEGLNLGQTEANAATNAEREEQGLDPLTDIDFILDGIDADEAALIAAKASTADGNLDDTTYEAEVDPGLYLVLITPASDNKDVVYKPVIVSADYDQTTASPNTVAADTESLPAPTTAATKKSPLTLTKTATAEDGKPNGVAVGDELSFTVESCVPTYTGNFTNPVYKIADVLSAGLTLDQDSITVAVEGFTIVEGTDYNITGKSASGYTVTFTKSFLNRVSGNPTVTITYDATVTSDAATQVNEMDNTVTLNFSNTPSDTSGAGELKDKTRHYTFDIDGNVFGSGSGSGTPDKTKEVEKVSVDGNGNIIETITSSDYPSGLPTGESPLSGAKFQLRTTAAESSTALHFDSDGKYVTTGGNDYVLSGSDGSITMKGLDEGTYFLVETEAPAGYSFDPSPKTVVIAATYVDDADGNKVLSSYKITIDGNESEYTAKTEKVTVDGEEKDIPIELTDSGAEITATSTNTTTLLINKKLGILPSTGGSGIYFYLVVGGVIAGASAVMLRKIRKEEELLA